MNKKKTISDDELRYLSSGIGVKAAYGPNDVKDLDYDSEIADPGKYPFVRGLFPTGYRKFAWQNSMISGYGLPEEANARQKFLRQKGAKGFAGRDSINYAFDNPCQNGYDCDHHMSKYEIGTGGIFVNTMEDMEALVDGFSLDRLNIAFIIDTPGPIIFAMYVALADKLGIPRNKLHGIVNNNPWRRFYAIPSLVFPPKHTLRVLTDCITWAAKEVPNFNTFSVGGYELREAGGNAAHEIAFAIAPCVDVIRACKDQGANVDEFIPNLNLFLGFHSDFFEEVAKLRAGRKVWAKLMRERFGVTNPKTCRMKIHLQTAGCTLTAQEPLNNIARVAIQALGAVMSGVQSLSTDSYDEAISLPTEESVRVALKTQKIIEHETGLTNVADPLGGSYYVENLTNQMEKRIWAHLDHIEKIGGYIKALESGYLERELADTAMKYQTEIEEKKRIIVGVNAFVEEEISSPQVFDTNPEIRKIACERLRKYRDSRDTLKVEKALENIKAIAKGTDSLMPAYIDAANAGATMGEMMEALKDVFGVYGHQNILAS